MSTAADLTNIKPGDWLPTGWGAQHRVRSVTDTHIVLACHGAGPDQHAERDRVRVDTAGEPRCSACQRAGGPDGLGPSTRGVIGEVRRTPEGWIAVCVSDAYERWVFLDPRPPGDRRWGPDWFMGNAERIAVIPGTVAAEPVPAGGPRPVVDVALPATEPASAREPRRWPEGSEEPREDKLTVRYADGEVRFRYRASWGRWEALPPEGDGDNYAWHEINDGSNGDLVEVLDDTPGGAR